MRGRKPKPPHMRQRRNRPPTSSAALPADRVVTQIPPMPTHRKKWHRHAVSWWNRFWRSAIKDRLLESDIDEVYMALELWQRFWESPSPALAAEYRRQVERIGKDPMARRRLDWNIRETKDEEDEPLPKKAATGGGRARPDPRLAFRVHEGGKP